MRPLTWIGVAFDTENSGAGRLSETVRHTSSLNSKVSRNGFGMPPTLGLVLQPVPAQIGGAQAGRAGQERAPRPLAELVDRDGRRVVELGTQFTLTVGLAVGRLVVHDVTSSESWWSGRVVGRRVGVERRSIT